jgi:flagellar assembly protein FliH
VFKHTPKFIRVQPSGSATAFVSLQNETSSDFEIADVVAQQAGISAMKQKQLEDRAEEAVLERMKEVQEQAYKQAYDLGLTEGAEKAYQDKNQELVQCLSQLESLCKGVEANLTQTFVANEGALIQIIFQIAERIAHREIAKDPEPIIEIIRKTVDELQAAQRFVVKINPADFKFIEELKAKNPKTFEPLARVNFETDEKITSGGCLMESDFGTVDATVEQRVERAWQAIQSKVPTTKATDPQSGTPASGA